MKLSPLFMEIWSFETIHCLNCDIESETSKRHGVTNDVKVKFLICGSVGCMKNMLFLANIHFSSTAASAKSYCSHPSRTRSHHVSWRSVPVTLG